MAGMLAGVAAVIFDVVINMAWPILKKKRLLPIAVMLAAFVATRFFSVNIILIILVCGVIGALDTLYLQKKEVDERSIWNCSGVSFKSACSASAAGMQPCL